MVTDMAGPCVLHVLNGDATRSPLERSGVPGEFLVWVDVFHDGPVPAESPDDFRRVRARHLAAGHEHEEQVFEDLSQRDRHLDRYREYDEVVFWFEHDLFDQLLLIRHLHWIATLPPWPGFRLICIDAFPGRPRFHGLGELTPPELATLFPSRSPVTPAQVALGQALWDAFRAQHPERFADMVLSGDTSALPLAAGALRRVLEEFPGSVDGLSRSERQILRAAGFGLRTAPDLFRACSAMEERVFMGDWTFWEILRGLTQGRAPLLAHDGTFTLHDPPTGTFAPTPAGMEVLAGGADAIDLNGIDRWIGGTHLTDGSYRWMGTRLEIR
jgi:hypothetical protein